MKTINIIQQILIFAIILCLPSILHAQPSFDDNTIDAPIDGGLSILIASGVGYGIKKINRKHKSLK